MRAVDVDRFGKRWAVHDELHPRRFDERLEGAGETAGKESQVGRLERGLEATRLDARKVEQAVHEAQEPDRASVNCPKVLSVKDPVPERVLDRSEDQRKWRAEPVADVRAERGLRSINLREGFRAPSFLFVGTRIGQGGRDARLPEILERTLDFGQR